MTAEPLPRAHTLEAPIEILIVDDDRNDCALAQRALQRAGITANYAFASTEFELHAALMMFTPDIVLCDFGFPGSDGLAMQRIVREHGVDAPLIFVSGSISEQRAVTALQSGAVDYVMKSNLLRLPNAVIHAVATARERRALQQSLHEAEAAAREHAERLEGLWRIVNNPALHDSELFLAMLRQAATTVRPGFPFSGMLWRANGNALVVEAVCEDASLMRAPMPPVGSIIPIDEAVIGMVMAEGGGTRAWSDVTQTKYWSAYSREHLTRALIVTTFAAGGSMWGLSFSSPHVAERALGPQDCAYIDVLASFFANRVQQRWQSERIRYQQAHDVLTGLVGRSQFRSQTRIAAADRSRYAMIIVDISDFHAVNDMHGHLIGDALLVEVAHALQRESRDGEIVGRIGSDVFGIFVPDVRDHHAAEERAAAMLAAFNRPFSTGDRAGKEFISADACVGYALAPEDGDRIDTVFGRADLALLAAKQRGPHTIQRYAEGMQRAAWDRALLKSELATAVAENQFELVYQPHIEIGTGRISGCEALIRWNHPERGQLAPASFIPFAEENGAITAIDQWVLRTAFDAARDLSVDDTFRLYFNLSGRQTSSTALLRSFTAAARAGVPLHRIGVEITETDAMRDVDATRRVCRALRRLDVKVAIDDFGTGYSSLSSLKRIPVDIVKIDRSFVNGIVGDRHDRTIAETILAITKHFGFDALAEGVENVETLGWLGTNGCRYAQGYHISYPVSLETLHGMIAADNALRAG